MEWIGRETWDALVEDAARAPTVASRLGRFAGRAADASGGRLSRIVFLFDEVDILVRPFLQEDPVLRAYVDDLLRGLRGLSQTRSEISFVLTGTNLIRHFLLGGYDQAFFGSIELFPVGGLDWEDEWDRAACKKLVFPRLVAERLRPERNVPRYVHEVAGGVPYYLSCIGFAVAQMSLRSRVTRATVNHTIAQSFSHEALWSNKLRPDVVLKILEPMHATMGARDQWIGRLLLFKFSKFITLNFRHCPKHLVVDDEQVRNVTDNDESLTLHMIDKLASFGFIELDGSRVSFSVPLFGEALRARAESEIPNAIHQIYSHGS